MTDFSIVIPAYNSLPLLQRALGSVCQQQEVSYQVIITDDSTTDDIRQYIHSLDNPHVKYYHHTQRLGAISNWNHGLEIASSGQYIILMHHDEAMNGANHLAKIKRDMEQKQCDIVVTNIEVHINGNVKSTHFTTWIKRYALRHPSLLFLINTIGPCACFAFRKEQLQPFCEELHWLVDVEWYYRMLNGKHAYYDKSIVTHSIHGHQEQITQNIDIANYFETDRQTITRLHNGNRTIRRMLWFNKILIINTKKLFRKI